RHEPATLARAERTLAEAFPARFLLGRRRGEVRRRRGRQAVEGARGHHGGVPRRDGRREGHGARPGLPAPRVLAALGPRMLEPAARRTRGAHPFLMPVEHTAYTRERVGPDVLLAVHQTVVLDPDRARAMATARAALAGFVAGVRLVPSRWRMIREVTGSTTPTSPTAAATASSTPAPPAATRWSRASSSSSPRAPTTSASRSRPPTRTPSWTCRRCASSRPRSGNPTGGCERPVTGAHSAGTVRRRRDSMGIENPDADVVEQLQSADGDDEAVEEIKELPSEADPADVAEQHIAVPDDDDYDR